MSRQKFLNVEMDQEFAGSVVKLRIAIKKNRTEFSFNLGVEERAGTIHGLGYTRSEERIDIMELFYRHRERDLKTFGRLVERGYLIFLGTSPEQMSNSIVKIVSDVVRMMDKINSVCPHCSYHYAATNLYASLRKVYGVKGGEPALIVPGIEKSYTDMIHNLACYFIWDDGFRDRSFERIQIEL